jgi:hypothetical protein
MAVVDEDPMLSADGLTAIKPCPNRLIARASYKQVFARSAECLQPVV